MSKTSKRIECDESGKEKKSKKSKKLKRLKPKSEETQVGAKQERALLYLQNWANKKKTEWKFNKLDQVWLLKNWKNEKLLSDELFPMFVDYVKGLAEESKAKATLLDEAQATFNNENVSSESNIAMERSRVIIQSVL